MKLLSFCAATAVAAAFLLACGDSPTFPEADLDGPSLAKGGQPGKPPPPPDPEEPTGDIPVKLIAGTGGVYPQGGDVLLGEVEVSGRFWMSLNPKKNETETPKLCVVLPTPTTTHDDDHWAEFVTLADLADPIETELCIGDFAIHTRDEAAPGLYDLPNDQTIVAGGKIALDEFSTKNGSWEWRLIWDTSSGNLDDTEYGLGVCVTREDTDTWRVHNECDEVDSDMELWRVSRDVGWNHVADFEMPFSFSLARVQ